jgi:hypothetical protein
MASTVSRKSTKTPDPSIGILKQHSHANKEATYLGLKYKSITVQGGEWWNLETSRRIKKLTGRIYLLKPRVAGNASLIIQFMTVNNLELQDLIIPTDSDLLTDIQSLQVQKEPRVISCRSVDDVPIKEAELLQPFSFCDLTLEAIVTNIVDGDTMDCMAMVDPYQLAMPCTMRCGSKTVVGQRATICTSAVTTRASTTRILMSFRIRLFGVDAADCASAKAPTDVQDRMRNKKNAATEFVKRWCKESSNRIWLQYMGYGFHGRTLGALFQRGIDGEKSKEDLTSKLLKYRHPKIGKVAVPYEGGNKKDAWMD